MDLTVEDVRTFLKNNWKWVIPSIAFVCLSYAGFDLLTAAIVSGALLYGFYQPQITVKKEEK